MLQCPRWLSYPVLTAFSLIVIAPILFLVLSPFWHEGHISGLYLQELILSTRQLGLLKTSMLLAGTATSLALVLGLPYALLVERTDLPGRSLFGLAYIIPLLIPPYMQAIVWDSLLAKGGWIAELLPFLIGGPFEVSPFWAAALSLSLAYYPFVTLLTISGLRGIDRSYEDAGILHRSPWSSLSRITVPLAAPHIISGALFVFIFSIIDFGVPDIFRLRVYPLEIFIQFSGLYDEKAAVALAFPLLLLMAGLVLIQVRCMKGRSYVGFGNGQRKNRRFSLGRAKFPALAFSVFVLCLSVFIPVLFLIRTTGTWAIFMDVLVSSWPEIVYSFAMAFAAALIMTVFAFFIAYIMERSPSKYRGVLEYMTQLPFAIPAILLGVALIKLWNHPVTAWLYGSSFMIIIGYVAHFAPFSIRVVLSSLKQINPHLEEIGHLAGHNWLRTAGRILVPLTRTGLLTAFFIGFILSLGDLGISLLIIPPGIQTIPIKIYNFMHYGAEAKVAALSLALLGMQLILVTGLLTLYHKTTPSYERP
ncbi:MAG: iron ABC transporter permease [Desulfobulbaceae bacterium]|nr:iron ABC transporter permease [Desulfobulbaceae bacterium]